MKRFFVFLVVLLSSSALVFGCGGAKKKDKTAKPGGPVMEDPGGGGVGGPVGTGDQSTGDAVPTGPGEMTGTYDNGTNKLTLNWTLSSDDEG